MKLIPAGLSQKVGRQILTMQKNSPRTLFGIGIVGVVVSTVLACRATLKLEDTLTEFKENVDGLHENRSQILDQYGQQMYNKDVARVYATGSYKLVKLYSPALIIGSASIAALTGSHVVLSRRNSALTAAYSAVSASFQAYRDRVQNELGEEKERELYQKSMTETLIGDERIEEILRTDPNKYSIYARFFDEYNLNWVKNAEYNRMFIQCQQRYANDLLVARGHVFLNEVYDQLGIPRSQAGQVVGWVLGPDGDNYVDFGIFEIENSQFVNGMERSILLDFNVDGVVFDKI